PPRPRQPCDEKTLHPAIRTAAVDAPAPRPPLAASKPPPPLPSPAAWSTRFLLRLHLCAASQLPPFFSIDPRLSVPSLAVSRPIAPSLCSPHRLRAPAALPSASAGTRVRFFGHPH